MSAARISIPHSQRAALRHYFQTTNPKPTHSALRAWFKSRFGHEISQSIVSRSLGDSFAWLDVCVPSVSEYRIRNCQWPWIETILADWLQEVEGRSSRVSNDMIGRKAKQLWEQSDKAQGLATPSFSTGWVVKFRRRQRMRLQPFPDQYHITVTPQHSLDQNSTSHSHGSAADTSKQASLTSSSLSNAATTISSTKSTSLNSGITASATLVFSSDHLIHLIQYNVLRALVYNKSLLLGTTLKLKVPDSTASIKQFPTNICAGLTVIRPLVNELIPDSLYPTQLQMNCAHTDLFNAFPFPKFRDNLIRKGVHFVPEEMFRDLFGDIFPEYITSKSGNDECTHSLYEISSITPSFVANGRIGTEEFEDQDDYTAGRRCLISWGDPWIIQNWEVTPGFVKRWGWALEGCNDLIQASNRWRALRNEKPIICM